MVERGKMTETRFEKIYPNKTSNDVMSIEEDSSGGGGGGLSTFGNQSLAVEGIKIFEKTRLTKQERLHLECLKPRHQVRICQGGCLDICTRVFYKRSRSRLVATLISLAYFSVVLS